MNDNAVKRATYQCPVCGELHSHNADIFIHKNLREIPDENTFAGLALCEEHDRMHKDGFLAMIAALPPEAGTEGLSVHEATRTGEVVHIKEAAWDCIMKVPFPDLTEHEFVFVAPEVVQVIKDNMPEG